MHRGLYQYIITILKTRRRYTASLQNSTNVNIRIRNILSYPYHLRPEEIHGSPVYRVSRVTENRHIRLPHEFLSLWHESDNGVFGEGNIEEIKTVRIAKKPRDVKDKKIESRVHL